MPGLFSGGGGGTQTSRWEPPDYTKQPWQDYIARAGEMLAGGLQPYGGQTVANFSPMLGGGLQMLTDYAMQGTPERAAGGAAILNATQGNMNPYATVANPFMGGNPYLDQMINASNAKITDQYKRGVAAQTDAAAARAGAYGGSGYQEAVQHNQEQLLGSLANNTNSLLSNQYNQSANMAENALNRATGAYDNTMTRALQGAQIGQGQQGLDLGAIQAMIQGGQIPMAYQQKILDAGQNYYNQQQQAPFTLMDFLGGALSRASGGMGTQTNTVPGQSNAMGLLGAVLGGAGGLGMFG